MILTAFRILLIFRLFNPRAFQSCVRYFYRNEFWVCRFLLLSGCKSCWGLFTWMAVAEWHLNVCNRIFWLKRRRSLCFDSFGLCWLSFYHLHTLRFCIEGVGSVFFALAYIIKTSICIEFECLLDDFISINCLYFSDSSQKVLNKR
jgi:hypothetical protein